MQRIFKYGDIRNISLTPYIWYRAEHFDIFTAYVIIYKSYTLLKMVRFLTHSVYVCVATWILLFYIVSACICINAFEHTQASVDLSWILASNVNSIGDERLMFSGLPSVRPPSVNTHYAWRDLFTWCEDFNETWHKWSRGGAENVGVENTRVENAGVDRTDGKCRSGKYRSDNVWKAVKQKIKILNIFTALHVMQTRYCDENSICPSVCPSVCHTRVLWQNGRKICPDFYTIRKSI